jgi:hypothetical protein
VASYVAMSPDIGDPKPGNVWRNEYGVVHGTVQLKPFTAFYMAFDDPAMARAVAAACVATAEAMEAMAAEPGATDAT